MWVWDWNLYLDFLGLSSVVFYSEWLRNRSFDLSTLWKHYESVWMAQMSSSSSRNVLFLDIEYQWRIKSYFNDKIPWNQFYSD